MHCSLDMSSGSEFNDFHQILGFVSVESNSVKEEEQVEEEEEEGGVNGNNNEDWKTEFSNAFGKQRQ